MNFSRGNGKCGIVWKLTTNSQSRASKDRSFETVEVAVRFIEKNSWQGSNLVRTVGDGGPAPKGAGVLDPSYEVRNPRLDGLLSTKCCCKKIRLCGHYYTVCSVKNDQPEVLAENPELHRQLQKCFLRRSLAKEVKELRVYAHLRFIMTRVWSWFANVPALIDESNSWWWQKTGKRRTSNEFVCLDKNGVQ